MVPNPDQTDTDGDAVGNACDPDDDNDGVLDGADGCPLEAGPLSNGCPFNAGGQSGTVNPFLRYESPAQSTTTLPAGTTSFVVKVYYGATINSATFKATLNGAPFAGFTPVPGGKQSVAIPLAPGRNVLLLEVQGLKPDGRPATDRDRLVFIVQ